MIDVDEPYVTAQTAIDAHKATKELLEKAREETPKFPRWFACSDLSNGFKNAALLCRHVDPGKLWFFFPSVGWLRCDCHDTGCSLEGTLAFVRQFPGLLHEITRADAYALTGGNP